MLLPESVNYPIAGTTDGGYFAGMKTLVPQIAAFLMITVFPMSGFFQLLHIEASPSQGEELVRH